MRRLVLDWDGTVTERDTLDMLLSEFGRPLPEESASFREVMEREMATLPLSLADAVDWLLEHARVRPGFHELAREHRPLIASSSFEETIRPILRREGVELEVVANRVDARPDGWRVLWRDESTCPECGDVCKRGALPEAPFAYGPFTTATPPNPGVLTVNPSGDAKPPAVPAGLRVVSASPAAIELAWDAVAGDPTLYGYEVLRDGVQIARVTDTSYADMGVVEGRTYAYAVRSVDLSFNRSPASAEVSVTAQRRLVSVTFTATVPATTDGTGRSVYIAGTLHRLDPPGPEWNPGGVALNRLDATHWSVTLTGLEGTQLEYKYTLGDWEHVEKDGACGEIGNRQLTLSYGPGGAQTVVDTVENWRNVAPCGN